MTAKKQYRQLCETEGARIPLFQQYWWMEAVCEGKQWDVLLVRRDDGTVEGALPYLHGSRFGLRYILQPELTQYNGPWYNHPEGSTSAERIALENRVGEALAKQLETLRINIFSQNFSPAVTNWLPFHWASYHQTTRYTYRFPSIADPDALISQASGARRKNLSTLAGTCTVDTSTLTPETFARMHNGYWKRRSGNDLLTEDFVARVCTAALERGQGLLWGLRNEEKLLCAAFVAYDERCAYALLSAANEEAPANAQTYLDWQMIRHLSDRTQAFDFEGSMEPGGEFYYRSFGTEQTPYFHITRCRPALLRHLIKL